VTHSTVAFPTCSFRDRVGRLVADTAARAVEPLPQGTDARTIARSVEAYLWDEAGFALSSGGRSALPASSVVEHRAHLPPATACLDTQGSVRAVSYARGAHLAQGCLDVFCLTAVLGPLA
jgi:hypothetical protein